MEDLTCTLQEFRGNHVLSFAVHTGLSSLSPGIFSPNRAMLKYT